MSRRYRKKLINEEALKKILVGLRSIDFKYSARLLSECETIICVENIINHVLWSLDSTKKVIQELKEELLNRPVKVADGSQS